MEEQFLEPLRGRSARTWEMVNACTAQQAADTRPHRCFRAKSGAGGVKLSFDTPASSKNQAVELSSPRKQHNYPPPMHYSYIIRFVVYIGRAALIVVVALRGLGTSSGAPALACVSAVGVSSRGSWQP